MTRRSKLVTLEVAAATVADGEHVALGGLWNHNAPCALVRELVRLGRRDLTLSAGPAAGYAVDLLIAGGGVARAHLANVTFEHLGLAPAFRRAVESGALELIESDEATLVGGFRAAAAGLPYQPVASIVGSALADARPDIVDGRVPALAPDVVFLHAQEGDEFGNLRHFGSVFADRVLAKAAQRAVVASVDRARLQRRDPPRPARDDDPGLPRHARGRGAGRRAPGLQPRALRGRRGGVRVTTRERMTCALAARLHDGEIVIIGGASPIPMAAALLAQRTTAPNLTLLTGSGAVNPRPERLAPSGGDYEYVRTAEAYFTMEDVFDDTERGRWDVGIFGGLQIDRHGHFNLAFVGGFRGPGLVNAGLPRTVKRSLLCVERHTPRVFVEDVDFVSGSGNDACVTDLALPGLLGRRRARVRASRRGRGDGARADRLRARRRPGGHARAVRRRARGAALKRRPDGGAGVSRWSPEQAASYYASGLWDRRGLFELLAEHPPDKLAFHDGVEAITFGALRTRAAAIAGAFEPGAVIAVRMGNSIDHVVLAYAIAAAGAVLFELPPDTTPLQVEAALRRTRAAAYFTDGDPLPTGTRALPEPDTEALALLIGTSGTTGTPKIAMRSTNGSCAMARHVLSCTGIARDDVVLIAAPLSGGVGYINGLCSTAITGCSTILPRTLRIEALMELLERHRVSALCTLPTLAVRMLAAPGEAPALRVIQTGGAYLHPQVAAGLEARFDCRVVSAYGAIDVGIPSMVKAEGDTAQHRHETVGKPFPEAELALIDGEVVMRGPSTALGYFEDEEATRAVYDDEGWGHFGDLGRIDEDGYLRIVGRLKEVINRGGKKISVNEVENHVRAFPGVRDVAAVGYDDPELGERCCAVVVSDDAVTLEALRAFLTERGVPKLMWPERVHHLDELPMSPQGKVRRRELKELLCSA